MVGGRGWLLGDAGGGFWIGHAVAWAVVASLDGQGQGTALTDLVLDAMGIEADTTTVTDVQRRCGSWSRLYARPPVSLADHSPSRPTRIPWLALSSSARQQRSRTCFLPCGHRICQARW